jgi:hypothetical protein
MNITANPKSKDARCANRASPSAADTYELPFDRGDPICVGSGRIALYNFRSGGWKARRVARYGIFRLKIKY